MKNFGKTIDQLILVDKDFEKVLKPLKNKWKRYPKRTENYWTELLNFLNSDNLMTHPKRERMSKILNNTVTRKRLNYSFETISMNDKIIGTIIGHLADKTRRLDLRSIAIAKERVEANMTYNRAMQIKTLRKEQILDIETKELWVNLRDRFNLWAKPGNYNIKISSENNIIYLVEQLVTPQFMNSGVIKMTPELLKKFLDYMGLEPPSDLFGDKK